VYVYVYVYVCMCVRVCVCMCYTVLHRAVSRGCSPSMLETAVAGGAEGELMLADMGQGFGFRTGVFDGAIRCGPRFWCGGLWWWPVVVVVRRLGSAVDGRPRGVTLGVGCGCLPAAVQHLRPAVALLLCAH
jgi:hypothetical protein